MTEQELSEIEARANAATPGKWGTSRWFSYVGGNYAGSSPIQGSHACIGPTVNTMGQAEADCAFIAHAREDLPKLIAEVRRLRDIAIGGAELHVKCPNCGIVSMTVCVGGKLK